MKKFTLLLLALFSILVIAKPQPIVKVGTIPGEFGVTSSGAATYIIPIDIPSGRSGMEPNLSLIYNSQTGTNIMGEGWSVCGFSSIVRADKSMYYNGTIKTIDFIDDEFLLNGSHLIKINESNTEIEYRTEIDEFSKIIFYKPNEEDHYGHFLVYHKSGTIAEYGYNTNSIHFYEDDIQGTNPAIAWHINKLYDRKGNYISYKYDQDPNSGELHPLFIYYTGYQTSNLRTTGSYEVAFYYEAYSDSSQSIFLNQYLSGTEYYPYKIQNTKRLKALEISYNSTPLKRYDLTYYPYEKIVSSSGKDFLKSVKLSIPYTTEQLNETQFSWDFYNPEYTISYFNTFDVLRTSRSKFLSLDIMV